MGAPKVAVTARVATRKAVSGRGTGREIDSGSGIVSAGWKAGASWWCVWYKGRADIEYPTLPALIVLAASGTSGTSVESVVSVSTVYALAGPRRP